MDKAEFSVLRVNGALPDPHDISTEGIIEDLWDAYMDSSASLLNELEAAALELERGNHPEDNSAAIRRILHSLKGESGMCGVMDVHNLTHEAEFAFEELQNNSESADMVLRVKDWIEALVHTVATRGFVANTKRATQPANTGSEPQKNLNIKTLVTEDNLVCRKRLDMLLKNYCDITHAVNGREGFEYFKQAHEQGSPYEFIALDIQMPEMDGHQTLEAVRKYEEKKGIRGLDGVKVIMTTSQEEPEHVFGAFREGCEAYVVKPVGEKLLEEMTKLGLLKTQPV